MIPGPFKIVASTELASDSSTLTLSDFSGIPAGSKHLVFMLSAKASSGTPSVYLRFNSDSSASYSWHSLVAQGASLSSTVSGTANEIRILSRLSSTAYYFGGGTIVIPQYKVTDHHKSIDAFMGDNENTAEHNCGRWASTSAITRADFTLSSGNFSSGSVAMLAVMDQTYQVAFSDALSGLPTLSTAGTEEDLVLVGLARTGRYTGSNDQLSIVVNGDSAGTNWQRQEMYNLGTSVVTGYYSSTNTGNSIWYVPDSSHSSQVLGAITATIHQASNGSKYPAYTSFSGFINPSGFGLSSMSSGTRPSASAITSIKIIGSAGHAPTSGSALSIYSLPRNRILNHELSSAELPIGGTLTSTTSDAIFGNLYARSACCDIDIPTLRFNNDATATNYTTSYLYYTHSFIASTILNNNSGGVISGATSTANVYGGGTYRIIKPHKTDRYKQTLYFAGNPSGVTGYAYVNMGSSRWANTSSITKWELSLTNAPTLSLKYSAATQFQVEGVEVSAAASSGFFLRFL